MKYCLKQAIFPIATMISTEIQTHYLQMLYFCLRMFFKRFENLVSGKWVKKTKSSWQCRCLCCLPERWWGNSGSLFYSLFARLSCFKYSYINKWHMYQLLVKWFNIFKHACQNLKKWLTVFGILHPLPYEDETLTLSHIQQIYSRQLWKHLGNHMENLYK